MTTPVGLDILRCPEGQQHTLVYRGKSKQEYYCSKCFVVVGKAALKKETD